MRPDPGCPKLVFEGSPRKGPYCPLPSLCAQDRCPQSATCRATGGNRVIEPRAEGVLLTSHHTSPDAPRRPRHRRSNLWLRLQGDARHSGPVQAIPSSPFLFDRGLGLRDQRPPPCDRPPRTPCPRNGRKISKLKGPPQSVAFRPGLTHLQVGEANSAPSPAVDPTALEARKCLNAGLPQFG